MSLGLFSFDGPALTSLRLAPLVASTAFITGVLDQQIAFSTFAEALSGGRQPANETLPLWLYNYTWRVIWVCGTAYPATIALLGLNLLVDPADTMSTQTKQLYTVGFVLTVIHCFPYQYAARVRKALWTNQGKVSDVSSAMAYFAGLNGPRLWVLDVPAWFFIFAAVVSQFG
ncbi:uncharacterized protein BP5553_06486 [Venustampulla echinocandica]|uniref:Integral membrane protein n=1 Tax=Venustampulla echinocandica TaxID=2656787 RepID=A0A370TK28_9HELO|nr:uncharacterized protein BP5553_06486 [Venustampulla echinocandica]RDL35874.1 hypothetical protein BP5553_06486 [Venustampulla echinocandica]